MSTSRSIFELVLVNSRRPLLWIAFAFVLGAFLSAKPADAELILYEPFNYNDGTNLNGNGGVELGFDTGSSWTYGGAQTLDILDGSIGFGSYPTSGNKAQYTNSGNTINEAASRAITATATSGDIWFSFLTQNNVAGDINTGKGLFLDETAGATGSTDGRDFSLFHKQNTANTATNTYGGSNASTTADFNTTGEQFMVLGKYGNVGTPGAPSKMWGITNAEYATIIADSTITEAELDATVPASRRVTNTAGAPTTLTGGFLNFVAVDFTNTVDLAYWVDEVRVGTLLSDVAPLPVIEINDTFNDGKISTNSLGVGNGFLQVTNGVGGNGTVSESGGQALIDNSGTSNNTGIVAIDTLAVDASDAVIAFWDIDSAANTTANGIELLVQGDTSFRGGGENFFLRLRPGGGLEVVADNANLLSTTYTGSTALDGFTATLTANVDGWRFDFTSLGGLTSVSGSGYGSSNFVDLFNGGRIAATVQGNASAEMAINQISVNVVPEPSTWLLGIAGLFGVVALLRRRHR